MDKDLQARQEARDLLIAAQEAQKSLRTFSQQQLNTIVKAICDAIYSASADAAVIMHKAAVPPCSSLRNV